VAVYTASPKHCEPITAQRPGTKCPAWSGAVAQELLNESIPMGGKRVATRNGIAFVAAVTDRMQDVWHGYPEAWDAIEPVIKRRWLDEGRITRRDLRRWATGKKVAEAWRDDDG
jgi:hypothetical protein